MTIPHVVGDLGFMDSTKTAALGIVFAGWMAYAAISETGTYRADVRESRDGPTLAVATTPGAIVCARVNVADSYDGIKWMCFAPDGRTIGIASAERGEYKVSVVRCQEGRELFSISLARGALRRVGPGPPLVFSPAGSEVIGLQDDQTICVWRLLDGKPVRTHAVKQGTIDTFSFSPDKKTLALRVKDEKETPEIRIVDWESGETIAATREKSDVTRSLMPTTRLAFSPDGSVLAFVSRSKMVYLWDYKAEKAPRALKGHTCAPLSVSFFPRGDGLLSSSGIVTIGSPTRWDTVNEDSAVRVWDLSKAKQTAILDVKDICASYIALSPDGRTFAIFDGCPFGTGEAAVWETATAKELLKFRFQNSWPVLVNYSPGGDRLAVAWKDGSVVVWPLAPEVCGPPKESLAKEDMQRQWQSLSQLEKDGAFAAYRAVCKLSDYPSQSLPLIKDRVKPVEDVKKERLQSLIADLDHDDFSRRDAASKELAKLINQAEPLLREALETTKSPEQAKRLKTLLKGRETWAIQDPELLQAVRAIWVLQRIGTPEAKALLEKLAAGAPTARQTQEAQAALEFLKRSKGR